jgi:hypothetical protein
MEMKDVKNILRKAAKEIEDESEPLAEKMLDAADDAEEIEKKGCAACLEHNPEKQVDEKEEEKLADPDSMTGIHGPNPTAAKKQANGLITENSRIICVNPVQGLFKGYIYIAGPEIEPGLILVKEETGKKVGLFKAERFLPDCNAF